MKRITYDMLDEFGQVVTSIYRLMYPMGLTLDELAVKAESYNWLRVIYERFREVR